MIEYRITTHNDKILNEFGKEDWQLIQILDNKMYWSRPIKKTRVTKPKEPQKPVTTYFSELIVKGHCSFYKDLEEAYFDWVRVRADSGKFAVFSDVSEKSAWKKLGSFPKPVAERMLENAGSSCYGKIYELLEGEISKIMEPLRQEKQKIERKREGFSTDSEKKEAEELREKIKNHIEANPSIRTEAKEHVFNLGLNMNPQATEKMIQTRCAMIAKNRMLQ